MPQVSPAKNWCFTLNNYTAEEQTTILNAPGLHYLVIGREVGESGTRHLQGFLQLVDKKRPNQVKAILGTDRVHLEKARGTPVQAADYCKKDGDYQEVGELRGATSGEKRTRDDLAIEYSEAIKRGGVDGITEFADSNPGVYAFSGHTLLRNYQAAILPKLRPECSVTWIVGPPGVGKSHSAWSKYPTAFSKEPRNKWWTGYLGQEQVIIDDLGKDSIDITHLLRWFDKWPVSVETKGGNMGLLASKFIVTSNFRPDEIYPYHDQLPALLRRMRVVEKNARDDVVFDVDYISGEE